VLLFVLALTVWVFNLGKEATPFIGSALFIAAFVVLRMRRREDAAALPSSTTPSPSAVAAPPAQPEALSHAYDGPLVSRPHQNAQPWASVMSLYSLRTKFFSRSELAFYRALTHAVAHRYSIFAKVRLLDLCTIQPTGEYTAMNKISAKHVDFLLCEPSTFAPVAAIEVDGTSHQRPDRIERDAFVDDLFDQIGLPLIRVNAAAWFEPADLLRRIEDAIVPSQRFEASRNNIGAGAQN
jgi:hypothetical protein